MSSIQHGRPKTSSYVKVITRLLSCASSCTVGPLQSRAWQAGAANQREESAFEGAFTPAVGQRADQLLSVTCVGGQVIEYSLVEALLADQSHANRRVDCVVDLGLCETKQQRVDDQPFSGDAANTVDRDRVASQQRASAGPRHGGASSITVRPWRPDLDRAAPEAIEVLQGRRRATGDGGGRSEIAERRRQSHLPGDRCAREPEGMYAESFDPPHIEPLKTQSVGNAELLGHLRREHPMAVGGSRREVCESLIHVEMVAEGSHSGDSPPTSHRFIGWPVEYVTCLLHRLASSSAGRKTSLRSPSFTSVAAIQPPSAPKCSSSSVLAPSASVSSASS
jgi:hypothetical protein